MTPRQKARLAKLEKTMLEDRDELNRRRNAWNRTGDRMDLYLYKSAHAVARKSEKKYHRYQRRVAK